MKTTSVRYGQSFVLLAGLMAIAPTAFADEPPQPAAAPPEAKPASDAKPRAAIATSGAKPGSEAKPVDPTAGPVNVEIGGVSNGLHVRVLPNVEQRAAANVAPTYCTQDCNVKLPTGAYTLVATQGERETTENIDVNAPLRVTVSESNSTLRGVGIGVGIAGLVVASLGTFVAIAAVVTKTPTPKDPNTQIDEASPGRAGVMLYGLAGIAVGAGISVGGFSIAGANGSPSVDIARVPHAGPPRPTGAGVAFSGKF